MSRFVMLLVLLAGPGCYLAHEAGGADACEPPAARYVRDDCIFCDAIHWSWLRRCGDRVFVYASGAGGRVRAELELTGCDALRFVGCTIDGECMSPAACAVDVESFEDLLETLAPWTPRGGAQTFEPYDPERHGPFEAEATCAELAARAPDC